MRGSRLTVVLNGETVINNAELPGIPAGRARSRCSTTARRRVMSGRARQASCSSATSRSPSSGRPRRKAAAERTLADRWKHTPQSSTTRSSPWPSNCVKSRCPQVGEGEVLLEVGAVSVCGSDVHQAHKTHSWPVNVPVVLGHEFGGTVARLGRGVRGFREGDRVVCETAAEICGECLLCRTGRYNLCPSRKGFGYGIDGAMAQWVRVPARCLHRIPDSLPVRHRLPVRTARRGLPVDVRQFRHSPGRPGRRPGSGADWLAVRAHGGTFGCGPVDCRRRHRRRPAARNGADASARRGPSTCSRRIWTKWCAATQPIGADLVCDATGASRPLEAALRLTRPDGQVTRWDGLRTRSPWT